jgi:2-oxo-4-hydroxy-4-carboxy--5-ureidoimidazoline (OHCU) decarboxylase
MVTGIDLETLDSASSTEFVESVGPLFEGAAGFLRRLAAGRPDGSWDAFFERARAIAHAMPEADQIELLDAHPRLGAAPGSMSALSRREQGYGESRGQVADVEAELAGLNAVYEARFGFRYCVFVAGRPHSALVAELAVACLAERERELDRGLDAVIDIAISRRSSLAGPAT